MAKPTKSATDPYQIRMPRDLRDHIERRLPQTDRTLSAEIRYLLRVGLDAVGDPMPQGDE